MSKIWKRQVPSQQRGVVHATYLTSLQVPALLFIIPTHCKNKYSHKLNIHSRAARLLNKHKFHDCQYQYLLLIDSIKKNPKQTGKLRKGKMVGNFLLLHSIINIIIYHSDHDVGSLPACGC